MEILKSIGIEPKLLLAQAINFFLLLFVLYKFLYKPILKALNERSKKVEESLKQCEDIEKKASETEEKRLKILEGAKKEASKIIKEARAASEDSKVLILKEAESKSKEILKTAKENSEKEKKLMMKELKNEISKIVSQSLEAIGKKNPKEYDDMLAKEAIAGMNKEKE